jgi:hypothetical protein
MELKGLQHELEFLFQDKFYRLSFSGKDGVTYFNNIDNLNIKFYRNKYKKLERVSLIELFTDNEIVIYDKTWANEQIKFMFSRFGLEFFDTSIESENEKTETEMENLKTLSQLIIMIENGNLPKDKFLFREGLYELHVSYTTNECSHYKYQSTDHRGTIYIYLDGSRKLDRIELELYINPDSTFKGNIYNHDWTDKQKQRALRDLS